MCAPVKLPSNLAVLLWPGHYRYYVCSIINTKLYTYKVRQRHYKTNTHTTHAQRQRNNFKKCQKGTVRKKIQPSETPRKATTPQVPVNEKNTYIFHMKTRPTENKRKCVGDNRRAGRKGEREKWRNAFAVECNELTGSLTTC